jgi:hypothetical protein
MSERMRRFNIVTTLVKYTKILIDLVLTRYGVGAPNVQCPRIKSEREERLGITSTYDSCLQSRSSSRQGDGRALLLLHSKDVLES